MSVIEYMFFEKDLTVMSLTTDISQRQAEVPDLIMGPLP